MHLTILGLPLGNITDISLRALAALDQADLIICEDTRVFHRLWSKLQQLGHLHHPYTGNFAVITDFNEKTHTPAILSQLTTAHLPLLVSDAGLPLISDPGYHLVNAVLAAGGTLDIIPGPTAAMTALSISGFSADRVLFLGFLPLKTAKKNRLVRLITGLTDSGLTVIIYESPHRLRRTLEFLSQHLPPSTPVVIARQLTKPHQELLRGQLSTISSQLPPKPQGELTLLLRL